MLGAMDFTLYLMAINTLQRDFDINNATSELVTVEMLREGRKLERMVLPAEYPTPV